MLKFLVILEFKIKADCNGLNAHHSYNFDQTINETRQKMFFLGNFEHSIPKILIAMPTELGL